MLHFLRELQSRILLEFLFRSSRVSKNLSLGWRESPYIIVEAMDEYVCVRIPHAVQEVSKQHDWIWCPVSIITCVHGMNRAIHGHLKIRFAARAKKHLHPS